MSKFSAAIYSYTPPARPTWFDKLGPADQLEILTAWRQMVTGELAISKQAFCQIVRDVHRP